MKYAEELQSLSCPLSGINLIEAAAGTGKTYNIQNLVVRLVLEREMPISEILVVTFTEAAAAELRERIHRALSFTLAALDGRAPEGDTARAEAMLARSSGDPARLLRRALRDFDDATIATIHGFCRKVLSEHAFESGVLFNSELEPDMERYWRELCADFFRRKLYAPDCGHLEAAVFDFIGFSADAFGREVKMLVARPELEIIAGDEPLLEPSEYRRRILDGLSRLADCFSPGVLTQFVGLMNKGYYGDDLAGFEAIFELAPSEWGVAELRTLARLTHSALRGAAKKKEFARVESMLDDEPFFDAVTELFDGLLKLYPVALKLEALAFVRDGLERGKMRDNVMSFDDLLRRVRDGVSAADGRLLRALQEKYHAGIIDEFQDTDSVQYEIFSHIFAHAPEPVFFMVGDPRQAIYSFRGGDLATYRRADLERFDSGGAKYTLSANYRSAAPMIEAVNRIFADHKCPFASPGIGFKPITAPEPRKEAMSYHGEPDSHVLRVHRLPEAGADECASFCAGQILELLNSDWRLPGRESPGVRPNDIAVLVYGRYEAERMRDLLGAMRIPAVYTRTGNVFASEDATEFLCTLQAVLDPQRKGLVCNALATAIGGRSESELAALHSEEESEVFAEIQKQYFELGERWRQTSFIEMFHAMLTQFAVRERYPALAGGERKLTNLLQLGDLLQQRAGNGALSPGALLAFLASAIRDCGESVEEYEQLLETDREAVKIMTVHGSKGLEFPIVMLPGLFLWYADDPGKNGAFHRQDGALAFDLAGGEESREQCYRERLQELLRLTYVALTRAKYRCHLFWGKLSIRRSERCTTPLDWLFRMRNFEYRDDFLELLQSCPPAEIPPELVDAGVREAFGTYLPQEYRDLELEYHAPKLEIDAGWKMLSYSSLSPHSDGSDRLFDDDREDADNEVDAEEDGGARGIFSIPGGAAVGNAWHRILELIDFHADDETIREAAYLPLLQYGIMRSGDDDKMPLDLTCRMVRQVLDAPLTGEGGTMFHLADVAPGDRLSELEFNYQFRTSFTVRAVRELVAPYAEQRFGMTDWPEWERDVSGGYLNGFIDLIFRHDGRYYILDWKSNRLNGSMRNFGEDGLRRAMAGSFYFLQYLFYTVALVKYLRMRLGRFGEAEYEEQFGGVFYLFLRGVAPQHPGRGVFFERPPYGLICELENLIG